MRVARKGSKSTTPAKAKTTKAAPKKTARVVSSNDPAPSKWTPPNARDPDYAVDRAAVNLLALPGGGKTGFALSISEAWDPSKFKRGKPIVFDDLIHVGHDETPLVGFRHLGFRVPYHFDVRRMMVKNEEGVSDTLRRIADEAGDICTKIGGIKAYIDDTWTMADFLLQGELAQYYESPQIWLKLKAIFQEYRMTTLRLPGTPRLIGCFHLTDPPIDVVDKNDPRGKEKRKARDYLVQGESGALLTPAVQKSIKQYFFGAGSMEVLCRSYKSPQGKWQYEIRLADFKDVRTKNRFREVDGVGDVWKGSLRGLLAALKKGGA